VRAPPVSPASELASNGHQVTVLEARERPGGRILTDIETLAPLPIELGAEFIHGESPILLRCLAAAGDVAVDASRDRWTVHGSTLRRANAGLPELKRQIELDSAAARAAVAERRPDPAARGAWY